MSDFLTSTQATHWLLTPSEVSSRREESQPASKLPPSDCSALEIHHSRRILHLCNSLRLPPKVAATALTYLKRFYLDHSISEYDPSAISLCSLYAAGKVEEILINADDLAARADAILNGVEADASFVETPYAADGATRIPAGVLLRVELAFVEELRFHLICFHPYRSLGIVREVLKKDVLEEGESMGKLMACAEYILTNRALLSDLPLTQPPAIIAAAAAAVAARETGVVEEERVIEVLGGRERIEECLETLRKSPERVDVIELEKRRREVCAAADNFLTRAFKEEMAEYDLSGVDREEAERSKRALERAGEVLGTSTKKIRVS